VAIWQETMGHATTGNPASLPFRHNKNACGYASEAAGAASDLGAFETAPTRKFKNHAPIQ